MRIMESVTSTFKEGLILFYTLVGLHESFKETNYLSPLSGFHPSVPLPGGQDVPKYLRLEEDEDSV